MAKNRLRTGLFLVVLLALVLIVLLFSANIDSSPNRHQLSVINKNNQPCFYIDDGSFTRHLPEISNVQLWVQDLAMLGKGNDTQQFIVNYPEKYMPTPRNQATCFFLPNIKAIKMNNPYNIRTSFEVGVDFCLSSNNNTLIATGVENQPNPNYPQNSITVCTQTPLAKKYFWQN